MLFLINQIITDFTSLTGNRWFDDFDTDYRWWNAITGLHSLNLNITIETKHKRLKYKKYKKLMTIGPRQKILHQIEFLIIMLFVFSTFYIGFSLSSYLHLHMFIIEIQMLNFQSTIKTTIQTKHCSVLYIHLLLLYLSRLVIIDIIIDVF